MIELLSLPYSPWSEKARWALDHHGLTYKSTVYRPLLGELGLRVRQRRLGGRISVPVLFDGGDCYPDSLSIALYAERVGQGSPLFPPSHMDRIKEMDELSERGLDAGRSLSLRRMLASEDALMEMLPRPLRRFRRAGSRLAAMGVRRTLRKYLSDHRDPRAELTAVLDALRSALRLEGASVTPGAPRFVCGEFTYADICASQVLQFVEPVRSESFRIGRASRASFQDPSLADRYQDLLAWRDALYAHRRVGYPPG